MKFFNKILILMILFINSSYGEIFSEDYLNIIYTHAKSINKQILEDKETLITKDYDEEEKLSLIEKYGLKNVEDIKEINERVQPINKDILLAQAILESGNGKSRYAKDGNNYLGIYTSKPEQKGIYPKDNKKKIRIQNFDSIYECVARYAEIINSASHYKEYREIRKKTNDPFKLVDGLSAYSDDKEYFGKLKKLLYKIKKTKEQTKTVLNF